MLLSQTEEGFITGVGGVEGVLPFATNSKGHCSSSAEQYQYTSSSGESDAMVIPPDA